MAPSVSRPLRRLNQLHLLVVLLAVPSTHQEEHNLPSVKQPPLPQLNIGAEQITTSGVSSGGAFSIQFHLAFSSQVKGAGLFAAPPYWCAQVGRPLEEAAVQQPGLHHHVPLYDCRHTTVLVALICALPLG